MQFPAYRLNTLSDSIDTNFAVILNPSHPYSENFPTNLLHLNLPITAAPETAFANELHAIPQVSTS
jgi:hypothetical protein